MNAVADYAAYAQRLKRRRRFQGLGTVLARAGINARIVLDPGDIKSWPGSGQVLYDLSGNAQDFNLGADATVSATDPTMVGTPGSRKSDAYISYDGGDYLSVIGGNPAWVHTIHKAGAIFSFGMLVYRVGGSVHAYAATQGTNGNGIGFKVTYSGGFLGFQVGNGVAQPLVVATTVVVPSSRWCFLGGMIDEAGGDGASFLQIDDVQRQFNGAYSAFAPSASNASQNMKIASNGQGAQILGAGSRTGPAFLGTDRVTPDQMMRVKRELFLRYNLPAAV